MARSGYTCRGARHEPSDHAGGRLVHTTGEAWIAQLGEALYLRRHEGKAPGQITLEMKHQVRPFKMLSTGLGNERGSSRRKIAGQKEKEKTS